ncbi:hypothetical protein BGP_5026 [Beggiatoa sp. PS]|nr:hypothetical protein BGP_5026 [Beggiatoa sp. PS]
MVLIYRSETKLATVSNADQSLCCAMVNNSILRSFEALCITRVQEKFEHSSIKSIKHLVITEFKFKKGKVLWVEVSIK